MGGTILETSKLIEKELQRESFHIPYAIIIIRS